MSMGMETPSIFLVLNWFGGHFTINNVPTEYIRGESLPFISPVYTFSPYSST